MVTKGVLANGTVIEAELKKMDAECRELEKAARRLFRKGRTGWLRFFDLFK